MFFLVNSRRDWVTWSHARSRKFWAYIFWHNSGYSYSAVNGNLITEHWECPFTEEGMEKPKSPPPQKKEKNFSNSFSVHSVSRNKIKRILFKILFYVWENKWLTAPCLQVRSSKNKGQVIRAIFLCNSWRNNVGYGQKAVMLRKVGVAFTFCNMKNCYVQHANSIVRQVARKCCPYLYFALIR